MRTANEQQRTRRQRRPRPDDDLQQLRAELELARAELARLRSETHRPDDVDRAAAVLAHAYGASPDTDDAADDAAAAEDADHSWARLAETERIRASLLTLCNEFAKALQATRIELEGDLPLVQADRRHAHRPALELVDGTIDDRSARA